MKFIRIDLSSSIHELRKEIETLKTSGFKVSKSVKPEIGGALVKSSDIEDVLYEASHEKKDYLT